MTKDNIHLAVFSALVGGGAATLTVALGFAGAAAPVGVFAALFYFVDSWARD